MLKKSDSSSTLIGEVRGENVKEVSRILSKHPNLANDKEPDTAQTPLHVACEIANLEMAQLLIAKKCDLNAQDKNGWTPLHCACSGDHINIHICNELINAGADITLSSVDGATAFHYFVRHVPSKEEEQDYIQCLKLFTTRGVSLIAQNKRREFPLHFGCMKGNIIAVTFLLEFGANPDLTSKEGATALHYSIPVKNSSQITALLLKHGANKYINNIKDETPMALAKRTGNNYIAELLSDSNMTHQVAAVRAYDHDKIKFFISDRSQVNCQDEYGMFPIMHSLCIQKLESLLLIIASPFVDCSVVDRQGNGVMHYAVRKLDITVDILKQIWEKGASSTFDVQNNYGHTPLQLAVIYDNLVAVKFLIQHKAIVKPEYRIYSVRMGQTEVSKVLFDAKIDVTKSPPPNKVYLAKLATSMGSLNLDTLFQPQM